jgi:hypothetical protein
MIWVSIERKRMVAVYYKVSADDQQIEYGVKVKMFFFLSFFPPLSLR